MTIARSSSGEWTWRRRLEGGGFIAGGRGDRVWMEASLPKRLTESNVVALGFGDAMRALEGLYEEARTHAHLDELGGGKVVRLDGVRDFHGVDSVDYLLNGLASVSQHGRVKVRRYADGERGQAQTLTIGPRGAWKATLYDKEAEAGPEAREQLRYEARMTSDLLQSVWARAIGGRLLYVHHINEEAVSVLTRALFERAGFHREVAPDDVVAGRVMALENMRSDTRLRVLGYLHALRAGEADAVPRRSRVRYERIVRDLGVTLAPAKRSGEALRLDYDAAEVRCA